jgi:hypothetical protein
MFHGLKETAVRVKNPACGNGLDNPFLRLFTMFAKE